MQAAYRMNRSTHDHLLVIHELFLEYRFKPGAQKRPLYFCFMDLRKAFDTILRHLLFRKVYNCGIKGKMLRVISDLYNRNIARVQVENFLSPAFTINKGVMQGSKLGPILFNIFINDLLNDLHNSSLGAKLGNLIISALGFADDIVLIADNPYKLQKLINICEQWAKINEMTFNIDKCNVMVFNLKHYDHRFYLGREPLKFVTSYKYLGIQLSSKVGQHTLFKEHFTKIIEKAETRLNCIKHFGFHKDGLRPQTAIRLYKILVRPILEYGAQILSFRRYFLNSRKQPEDVDTPTFYKRDLENLQTKALKTLIGCPRNVSPSVVRLMTGVEPLNCRLDMLKLRYYWKRMHTSPNIIKEVINYSKNSLLEHNLGFATDVFNLCCRVGDNSFWHGIQRGNQNPLNTIKRAVETHYFKKDLDTARNKNCIFSKLLLTTDDIVKKKYTLFQIFKSAGMFFNTTARIKFIKALLNPNSYLQECKLCKLQFYDILLHQLTTCPKLTTQRTTLKHKLIFYGTKPTPEIDNPFLLFSYALTNKKNIVKAITDFLEISAY